MENRKKILIIEDDEDISMIEEAYLESAGFETKILSDGNKVNEIIEAESFDLILLDLMLPDQTAWKYNHLRPFQDHGSCLQIPSLLSPSGSEYPICHGSPCISYSRFCPEASDQAGMVL